MALCNGLWNEKYKLEDSFESAGSLSFLYYSILGEYHIICQPFQQPKVIYTTKTNLYQQISTRSEKTKAKLNLWKTYRDLEIVIIKLAFQSTMIDLRLAGKAAFRSFDAHDLLFLFLFVFRYLRLVVHLIAFWFYKPTAVPIRPTLYPDDCTVIIPTVEPENPDFIECLDSVLKNAPKAVLIVTVGQELRTRASQIVAPIRPNYPNITIQVATNDVANKRRQVSRVIPMVKTAITVLVDDHVFWPSANFLRTIIAPFEDPLIGVVGTSKRVRRLPTGFGFQSFWNVIGALYLERHNFELRTSNTIDGGAFVISGRTAAHRTSILQDPDFIRGFTNEKFFFDKFGPLNADDDNFITRWEVRKGWKIKFQHSEDATIETTLGTYPKFLSQCLRWARTTWRSNPASLFTDRTVWRAQPWCVYAVYITSFFNFALFYDSALLYTLTRSSFGDMPKVKALLAWILISKMVKTLPYFCRQPADLIYLPGCILFSYYHSFIKLYAGLTFWVTAWGGRNLAAVGEESGEAHGAEHSDDNTADNNYFIGAGEHGIFDQNDSPHDHRTNDDGAWSRENSISDSHITAGRGRNDRQTNARTSAVTEARRHRLGNALAPINTPWGYVRARNAQGRAANVLEGQLPVGGKITDHDRRNPTFQNTTQASGRFRIDNFDTDVFNRTDPYVYSRSWARGDDCSRLHYEGASLTNGDCDLPSWVQM